MGRHVAGKLKQTNKKHKAGVASNRAQQRQAGAGKVAGTAKATAGDGKPGLNAKQIEQLSASKSNRMNHKIQLKKKKMDDTWLSRRIGTNQGPPKVVAVVPLSILADAGAAVRAFVETAGWSSQSSPEMVNASFLNNKARMCFISSGLDVMDALNAAKCADIVVFVVSACSDVNALIDETGSGILAALRAEGMPEAVCCIQGLMQGFDYESGMGGTSASKQVEVKKVVQATMEARVATDIKCIQEENVAILIRTISVCLPREVSWRISRSYLVSDSVQVQPASDPAQTTRNVRVSGYLRGTPMNLHSLMHVAGVGPCRIMSVETADSPFDAAKRHGTAIPVVPQIVHADPSK